MNGLDLFSGIGAVSLALRPWVRTGAYCEILDYCRRVLLCRMETREIDTAPIWDDVRTLDALELAAVGSTPVDIVTGGFPCQDLSVAGRGAGLAGERSGLFFEIVRIIGELRPRFVFLENVPAIRSRGADVVTGELARLGYDCRWGVLSAYDVGAPHLRERWFLLAHADRERIRQWQQWQPTRWAAGEISDGRQAEPFADGAGRAMANTGSHRLESGLETGSASGPAAGGGIFSDSEDRGRPMCRRSPGERRHALRDDLQAERWGDLESWTAQPGICGVATGVVNRVDRISALGNTNPPQQYREAFRRLIGL